MNIIADFNTNTSLSDFGSGDERRIASGTKHNKLHNSYKVNMLKLIFGSNMCLGGGEQNEKIKIQKIHIRTKEEIHQKYYK